MRNRNEFVRHGFGNIVTVENKNVLLDGFDLNHVADAGIVIVINYSSKCYYVWESIQSTFLPMLSI